MTMLATFYARVQMRKLVFRALIRWGVFPPRHIEWQARSGAGCVLQRVLVFTSWKLYEELCIQHQGQDAAPSREAHLNDAYV